MACSPRADLQTIRANIQVVLVTRLTSPAYLKVSSPKEVPMTRRPFRCSLLLAATMAVVSLRVSAAFFFPEKPRRSPPSASTRAIRGSL